MNDAELQVISRAVVVAKLMFFYFLEVKVKVTTVKRSKSFFLQITLFKNFNGVIVVESRRNSLNLSYSIP